MNGRIECNAVRWYSASSEQVPWVIDSRRTEITFDCNNLEDELWNFENASDCPWIGIFRPENGASGEVGAFGYGTLWVTRNSEAPHIDEDFASSYGRIIYNPTGGGDPTQQEFQGANVFNAAIYNLNLFTPLVQENMIADMPRPGDLVLGNSLLFNNIPIFRIKPDNTIDIHDETTYKGCAYKNGHFYQEPLNLDDPYAEDSAEDSTDNQGTNDWTPDNITEKELPPDFFGNSGLMKVLTPTTAELNAFSRYLWNDDFDLNQFKKIVNNPFDLILGFQYLPLKVTIAGQTPINVGNILSVDTGLTMSYPTQENYKHSFGSLNLTGQESKFLDYAPYSRTFIHLPYIGTQAIDTDLIRKCSPVELIYKYNIVTGTISAYLKGTINGQNGILYEWEGNVNNIIPVASNDYSNSISGMFSLVSSAVVGGISGGAIGGGVGAAVGAISGSVNGLNQADLKPTITSQGSIGGTGACLNATNDAFIVTIQQRLSVANQQAHYLGYPRNVSGKIKNNKGYNNIKGCRMSCTYAYQEELREIEETLINGYIYGDSNGTVISKPSTPSGNNVAFALYQNKSSNIRIDKSLEHLHTYDCILKDSTNIVNPTIRIKASDVNVTRGNYGYIPKFKRFYYVNNVRSINADIWEIDLHCDVLMSFRDDIIEHTVIFNHSESAYNLYLNDGSLQMDSRPKVTWNKFPNSLTNDGTYVLLLAGA